MNRLRTSVIALVLLLVLAGLPTAQAAPASALPARPGWCIPLLWRRCPEPAAAETAPVRCLALPWHKCPAERKITPQPSATVTPPPPKPLPTAQPPRVTPIGPPVPVNPVEPPPLAGAPARPQERVHPAPAAQSSEPVQADREERARPVPPAPATCRQCLDRATDK